MAETRPGRPGLGAPNLRLKVQHEPPKYLENFDTTSTIRKSCNRAEFYKVTRLTERAANLKKTLETLTDDNG